MENLEPVISRLRPVLTANFDQLTDKEINDFFDDLDRDKDGYVTFEELEAKLHEVHEELAPQLQRHHLLHPARRDVEKHAGHSGDGLHQFLCAIMPECGSKLNQEEFIRHVQTWEVPSQSRSDSRSTEQEDRDLEKKLPRRRRIRAYWAVHGPNIVFIAMVVALVLAIMLWQGGIYIVNQEARAALGWGVIMAKLNAGAIYPTFAFMLLSMSRHLSTFLRRSYYLSRFINWDYCQKFHIIMSCFGLLFATLHAIGHLTGSFLIGSQPSRQEALAAYLGVPTPMPYVAFVRTLPGWSGIVALGLYWMLSSLSMPVVRKWSYEVFQLGHLLMFPMIGLLCAHGTNRLLQYPMFGFWIAAPFCLVLFERLERLGRGFVRIEAEAKVMHEDAVVITCKRPSGKWWQYSAGQYVLLQVPEISFFQWHPFTISSCRGDELSLHIKVGGDWTEKLRDLVLKQGNIKVGLDGPFGAPAQRFYDYDYSIIVGGGIGITPFSAILTDLEERFNEEKDPWEARKRSRSPHFSARGSRASSRRPTQVTTSSSELTKEKGLDHAGPDSPEPRCINPDRRVDFHWSVREKNDLLWFSDLLNRAIVGAGPLAKENKLDLNINTHITAKRKNISTHVFRYILDGYRTAAAPYSALTGLKQRSHFGRPDFDHILEKHFQDLVDDGVREKKVGVFYCGTPVVGEILADRCHELTAKTRDMGLRIRYDFLMEVFG
ncbi:hypothetical protein AC578_1255 [Pseudocercospora eumusae]|uniref:FAD-binding FR-type domain-containing protein n=1 Tax=Pseudocercospora eumusae TaxID=321146 RepID=A0A139H8F2_9PEZI|nr:hypothetical protein AC578_1255 [Pseudocercospora eumusae]